MGAFDDVKKKNIKTYQQIMYEILQLTDKVSPPILNITNEARSKISSKRSNWALKEEFLTIGLNIGVGSKWPSKGWPLENWEKLIGHLEGDKFNTLLLGGPEEEEQLVKLRDKYPFLINTGSGNSLMEFTAIVDLCDLIVTADTLALHVATSLGKKIIALFGPTSSNEIELFEKGIKISSEKECRCYYRKYCSEEISCMKKISEDEVYRLLNSLIGRSNV
jgi:heptosyltransferase-2